MAFNLGDLIARLKLDTKPFEAGVLQAEQGLKKVEAAAKNTDSQVTILSSDLRELAKRWGLSEMAAVEVAYARMTSTMKSTHPEALKMNAALDAANKTAALSTAGIGRLNLTLASLARQVAGVHPAVGQLANVMSTMAVGTVATVGVLAGLAAIGFAIRKIGEESRNARERFEDAFEALKELQRIQGLPVGGATVGNLGILGQERNRLVTEREQARAGAPFGQAGRDLARLTAEIEVLDGLIASGEREIARAHAEVAAAERDFARRLESMAATLGKINASIQADMSGRTSLAGGAFFGRLRTGSEPGGPLTGQDLGHPGGGSGAFGRRTFADTFGDFGKQAAEVGRNMEALAGNTDDADGALKQFGDGLKDTLRKFLDPAQIGSQLAAQAIGTAMSAAASFVGRFFGSGETAEQAQLREVQERNIEAIKNLDESVRALASSLLASPIGGVITAIENAFAAARDINSLLPELPTGLPGDPGIGVSAAALLGQELAKLGLTMADVEDLAASLGIDFTRSAQGMIELVEALRQIELSSLTETFAGQMSLLERRAALLDLTAQEQFDAMRAAFEGSGISEGLVQQVAGLTPETVGEFAAGIIDQIQAGTFDPAQLGGLTVQQFLDFLSNMESLGDAAGDAAGQLGALSDSVRNLPTGYRVALARYRSETPVSGGGDIVVTGPVTVIANNADEFYESFTAKARREARRGGTNGLQLATSPSGV